jgi:CBS domain-containing protein
MTSAPASVAPQSSMAAAERVMREHQCHHVPVVDGDRVVGIVSAHDLVKALVLKRQTQDDTEVLSQSSLSTRRIEEVMQRNVAVLPHTATVLDAARALADGARHALPVVGPGNVLCGIVTSTDLIASLADGLKHPVADPVPDTAAAGTPTTDRQLRSLRELLQVAIRYLESGRGDLEHGRLLQAVNRARDALRQRPAEIL